MNNEQVSHAIECLGEVGGLKAGWQDKPQNSLDGYLIIEKDRQQYQFPAEVKREFRHHHLMGLLDLKERYGKLIVIADILPNKVKQALQQNHIAYVDGAGNIYIEVPELYILIEGKKQQRDVKKLRHRAFTKTGLKLVFHLLLDEELINATYRDIAALAGISLDTVSKTIASLQELDFIVRLDESHQKLVRKKDLLHRWIYQYGDKLKPALLVGNFRFLDPSTDWKKLPVDPVSTQWGGEPGGDLLTNYLQPEIFTLYTQFSRAELMKQLRLVPDKNGPIEVYQRFWKSGQSEAQNVPSLLVYADLIYSGDPRNLETAQRIYERYLQNEFE